MTVKQSVSPPQHRVTQGTPLALSLFLRVVDASPPSQLSNEIFQNQSTGFINLSLGDVLWSPGTHLSS